MVVDEVTESPHKAAGDDDDQLSRLLSQNDMEDNSIPKYSPRLNNTQPARARNATVKQSSRPISNLLSAQEEADLLFKEDESILNALNAMNGMPTTVMTTMEDHHLQQQMHEPVTAITVTTPTVMMFSFQKLVKWMNEFIEFKQSII